MLISHSSATSCSNSNCFSQADDSAPDQLQVTVTKFRLHEEIVFDIKGLFLQVGEAFDRNMIF